VWFSLPWSLEQFQQTRARLHRSGQKNTVFEHVMITDGTIDQIVAKSLREREQVQRAVIEALRRVPR
jgi:SNF2 family DNA or RNA helicase